MTFILRGHSVGRAIDLTSQRFGRLTVISFSHVIHTGTRYFRRWNCLCDCGKELVTGTAELRSGNTTSCGCYHREKTGDVFRKHGGTGTRLYQTWKHMNTRCYNPKSRDFPWYGGKGITVYPEWRNSFSAFRDWALTNGYAEDLTIDRKKSDQNYCPENCQWITLVENVKRMHQSKNGEG